MTLIWEKYCREYVDHVAADHNMNLSRDLQCLFQHTKKRATEPAEKSVPVARVSPLAPDSRNLLANRPVEELAMAKPEVSEINKSTSSIIARFANNKNLTMTEKWKPVEPPAAPGRTESPANNIVVQQQVLKEVKGTLLNPWTVSKSIKSEPVVKDLLRDVSLFAFFKCMGCNCPLTANDSNMIAVHLNSFEYKIVNEHLTLVWERYCRECGGDVAVDHELQHLFEHTKKRDSELTEKSVPVVKVARVSPVAPDPRNLLANRQIEAVVKSQVDESASSIIARFANNKSITIARKRKPVEPLAAPGSTERQPNNIVVQQQVQQQVLKEVKRNQLKPWTVSKSIKSDPVVKDLLREVSLFASFKCMGCNCPFTTNDSNLMAVHLKAHSGHSKNRGTVESSNAFSWLECCYCSKWTDTVMQLIAHITAEHSRDIYQCPYCFYRSCEEYNVILHLRHYHVDVKETILYCFGRKLLKVGGDVALQTLKTRLCSDCTLTFMNPLVFASHITKYTHMDLGGDIYKCYYCSKKRIKSIIEFARHIVEHRNSTRSRNVDSYKCFRCFKHQTSIGQLSNKHYINIKCYQCVHCAFSTDEELQMNLHMAQAHPSNLLFCGLRIRILPNTMGDDVSTRIIDNGAAFILLNRPVDERILFRCPYTPSQLNHMSASIQDRTASKGYQNESLLQSLPDTNCPIIAQNPGEVQIFAVTSITKSAFASLNDE